ncbi:MAG: hypothetical protein K8J31_22815, partial [Anaerolineae bacterium]|nr:hypothetical protein [Anaerolineae bacterium]
FRRTKLKGCWLLGKPGHSEVATSTRLPSAPIPMSLESGQTVFAYVGDTWGGGVLASEAIRQVIEAERGRFFIDREGQAVFLNRHHLLKATTSAALIADAMAAVDYVYGAETVSQVQVRLLPRSQGSAGTILWQLDNAQLIPAASDPPVQVVARFRDDQKRPIGALAIIPPVPQLDYQGRAREDGSGPDLTSSLDVRLRQTDFSAALLEIRNRSQIDVFLQPGARLRGTPLYTGDPLFVEQVSYGSLAQYSPQALRLDLPVLDSVAQADSLARYELARRKTPRGQVRSLTLSTRQHAAPILERSLYDRVTVQEAQTGHSADYFIVAEAHTVDLGGSRHHTTWTLESADATRFWVLGQKHLNDDTVLAY